MQPQQPHSPQQPPQWPPQSPPPQQPAQSWQQAPQPPAGQPTQISQQPQAQPQAQPDYSIDYLNQIAQPIKQSQGPSAKVMIGAIVAGLVVLIGFGAMLLGSGPSPVSQAVALNLRLETLQTVAKAEHKNLRNNELRATNTSYQLLLANLLRDSQEPMGKIGVTKKSTTKTATAKEKEYAAKLTEKFNEARLNINLDRTYARDMAYELGVVKSMMRSLYGSTKSKSFKAWLEASDAKLIPVTKRFSEFSASDS